VPCPAVPGSGPPETGRPAAQRRIRAWVGARALETQQQILRLAPTAIASSLAAAALAPMVQAMLSGEPGGVVAAAALGQLGAVGGAYLADTMEHVVAQMRARQAGPAAQDAVQEALADELERRITDDGAEELRRDLLELLRAIDAVPVALTAAFDTGVQPLQDRLARALGELDAMYSGFQGLRDDVLATLASIQRALTSLLGGQREGADMQRQILLQIMIIRTVLERRRPDGGDPLDRDEPPRIDRSSEGFCPYLGLAAFQAQDAAWFYGREALTATLLSRLAERLTGPSLLVVVGASGAGKSSVLNAGFLPALHAGTLAVPGSVGWPCMLMSPGHAPLRDLAVRMAVVAGIPSGSVEADLRAEPARFTSLVRQALLADAGPLAPTRLIGQTIWWKPGRPVAGSSPPDRLVLIVDQFEELFTQCYDEAERVGFIRALCAAASPARASEAPAAVVILGLRADFYASCTAYPELVVLLEGSQVVVGPMSTSELRDAIELPAQSAGLTLEDGLVEVILRDLGLRMAAGDRPSYDPGRLPLLSHALLATWQQRRAGRLDLAGYLQAGGIDQAVATTAEDLYESLDAAERSAMRQVLLHMVTVTETAEDIRRRVSRAELLGEPPREGQVAVEAVLEHLVRARLVTAGEDSLEITHEALLSAWPRLCSWIDEDREWLAVRRQLSDAARSWQRSGRDDGALYVRTRLSDVLSRIDDGRRADLDQLTGAFLVASEDRHARELRAARWRTRRLTVIVAAVLVLVTGTGALGAVANQQIGIANDERSIADSRQVAAAAEGLRDNQPAVSALLSVEAFRISPKTEASALLDTQAPYYEPMRTDQGGPVNGVAVSPDGAWVAGAGQDGTVELWDLKSDRRLARLRDAANASPVYAVALSPDGATIAAGEQNGSVELWSATTQRSEAILRGHLAVNAVAFAHHDQLLAVGRDDGTIELWNPRTQLLITTLTAATSAAGPLDAVAFSPDDRAVVGAGADVDVLLWDVRGESVVATLAGHTRPVRTVAFSPDGQIIATGGDDGTVKLWSADTHSLVANLKGTTGFIRGVAFSPDSRTLAAGADDGSVRLWNVASGAPPQLLDGPTDAVLGLAFTPDGSLISAERDSVIGRWDIGGSSLLDSPAAQSRSAVSAAAFEPPSDQVLATTSAKGTINWWRMRERTPYATSPPTPPGAAASGMAYRPDGRVLATSGADGDVQLLDPVSGMVIGTVDAHAITVNAITFSPDGHSLATAGSDGRVRLWDARSWKLVSTMIPNPAGPVNAVAFSPNGRFLASGGGDGTISLWRVPDGSLAGLLTGGRAAVEAVAFAPDGAAIADGSADDAIRLWKVSSFSLLATLPGHTQPVVSIAFSPAGGLLASAGEDRTVRLWSLPAGTELATFTVQTNVTTVAFSLDGRALAGADGEGIPLRWHTDAGQVSGDVCIGHPALNPDQWRQYVPSDLPYRSVCP
jgi:WD40 repeat protein